MERKNYAVIPELANELSLNSKAMENFSSMTHSERIQLNNKIKHLKNSYEIQNIVQEIADGSFSL